MVINHKKEATFAFINGNIYKYDSYHCFVFSWISYRRMYKNQQGSIHIEAMYVIIKYHLFLIDEKINNPKQRKFSQLQLYQQ